jgi:cytochrome d ubiquinol oxidase subunit I
MDLDPVFPSRLQFAFVISFHIIFPAFTIGLAAWLATIEGVRYESGNPIRRPPTRSASWSGGPQDG